MEASIFKDYISKYIGGIAAKITEKVNGKAEDVQYMHKLYLRKEFSPDMKYNSLSSNTSVVAADVVALDSELPLKSRGAYSSAEGEIPKLGMVKAMNESALQALKNLKARGQKEAQIVTKLFQDAADGVKGINERIDMMFFQALSTGVVLVNEDTNTGAGVRIDFGVPDENYFGVNLTWAKAAATPIQDIENVVAKARLKGYSLAYMFMDKSTFNAFKLNEEVLKAFSGYSRVSRSNIFRLGTQEVQDFLANEFGLNIIIIDKVSQIEKGGKKVAIEPWQKGNVTFTTTLDLGTVTYGELAELEHPVAGVEYSVVDDYILVSLFRTNSPLKENTSVQALALPVLDNTDGIFIMDTNEAQEVDGGEIEGDANVTIYGGSYNKATVIGHYNDVTNTTLAADITDADLIAAINKLSKANEDKLKALLGL